MEDEYGALLEREPPEGTIELVAVVNGQQVRRLCLAVKRQRTDVCMHATCTPGLGVALAGENPVQPRNEPLGIAQQAEVAPGHDEGRLDGIICPVGVAQDPKRDSHALIADQPGKGIEGLSIPLLSTIDER